MPFKSRAFFRIGLLPRIFVALVLISLAPLAVVTIGLFDANTRGMRDQVERSHAVAVRATATRLEAYLSSRFELGDSLVNNDLLIRDPQNESSLELLAATLQSQQRLSAIVLADAEGSTAVRVQRPQHREVIDRVLQTIGEDQVVALLDQEHLWIGFSFTLRDDQGRLFLIDDGKGLQDSFAMKELGTDAAIALIDSEGQRLMGDVPIASVPELLLEWALSRKVSGARVTTDDDGEVTVGGVWPLKGAPWIVISVQPGRVAEANAAVLRKRSTVALGLALALGALMLVAAHRTVVQPLRGILSAQTRLEGLEVSTPGNEIAQLQASFARLTERVRNKQDLGKVFLGRYQVLELLGEGGMGSVFRGWDPKLQRLVALKTIRLGPSTGTQNTSRTSSLLGEAILAARFSHSNVVSVYDVEDSEGAAFIAMELVEGESVEQYLKQRKSMSNQEAISIAIAVARALQAAHLLGIAHRDIKPANVLLGFDHSIKVTDFGIASIISKTAGDEKVFGTPGYIAPEAILGEGHREESDLFSLGVLLYQMLAGRTPFSGRNVSNTLLNTVQMQPLPLSDFLPDIPSDVERIVKVLIAKQPEDRFSSALAVAEELEDLARRNLWRWSYEPIDESGDTEALV